MNCQLTSMRIDDKCRIILKSNNLVIAKQKYFHEKTLFSSLNIICTKKMLKLNNRSEIC